MIAYVYRAAAICLALLGLVGTVHGQKGVAAVVNGEPVTTWDLEMAQKHAPQPPMGMSEQQRKVMQRQVLAIIIDEVLLQQFLKKTVPQPEGAVVQQRLAELEKSLKARQKTLADYCQDTGQTENQLRSRITTVIQWNAYVRKRISDEDIKRFFNANRDMFEGVTIRASHIFVKTPAGADAKAQQAALQQAQAVQRELLQGRDFAEVAKQYSQDESTAQRGGDLGYFPQRSADTDLFVRTASAMKVGQLSEPIRSEWGYHLIKLADRKPGKPVTFEEVKEEARLMCADELRLSVVAEQRKTAKVEILLP